MTTITYKDGVIAYDSRCMQGMNITDDGYDKHVVENGSHYFLSGCTADHHTLIAADRGQPDQKGVADAHALIWDGKRLWEAGFEDGKEFWKCPRSLDRPYSIGSGQDHAITAMDMGADAKTAVKMAMRRDAGTGGKIKTFKLPR